MLSETMTKKLNQHFLFRDLDKDGFVAQEDWEQAARNLAEIRGWSPGSPEYEGLMSKHIQMWTRFWKPADVNNDGKVSLEEYLQLAAEQRIEGAFALEIISDLFEAIFELIDLDGDGYLTREEYKLFFKAGGLDEALADQAFSQLDLNQDGRLAKISFLQFGANFYISNEPNMPGNWLFGPYSKV